jgi:hypothetical protein
MSDGGTSEFLQFFDPENFDFEICFFSNKLILWIFFEKWTQICWIVKYKLSTETSKIPHNLQIIIT